MRIALLLTVSSVVALVGGCVSSPEAGTDDASGYARLAGTTLAHAVHGADGQALRLALVEARASNGTVLWYSSTDQDGVLLNTSVGGDEADIFVFSGGHAFRLDADAIARPVEGVSPTVSFGERYAFPNPTFPVQLGTTCTEKLDDDTGCGLDEPSVEVDGRGWVYYTAACCFLVSSPVFVSKDNGSTFENLAHPAKDVYGNEGDLAVDNEGNLYYMDIDLTTFGIARWNPDLSPEYSYRRPGTPVVDRPWIRAGADGVVHAIYNTGTSTVYYRSTDYALTFTPMPIATLAGPLARAYSDIRHHIVGMVNGGSYLESTDDGVTWGEPATVDGCGSADIASVDEAGTVWFQGDGCVVGRRLDGSWTTPVELTEGYDVYFTWIGTGAAGGVAMAFYGQPSDEAATALALEPEAWYLFGAFSMDADAPNAHWAVVLADEVVLGYGSLGRALGDFFQVEVGPDGGIHFAYAVNPEMDDSATAVYRRTMAIPGLAPGAPLMGPF